MDPVRLADELTMVGLEVESVRDRYAYLETVFVGRIVDIRPHPNADKLQCCDVDLGARTVAVVCGAPNLAQDSLAPLALPGTRFPDDTVLTAGKIRGVLSEGMLCSAGELGLGSDRSGLMPLPGNLPVGTPLAQALGLSDAVLEIDLTPNRPDCLSLIGIAREVAAIQQCRLHYPEIQLTETDANIDDFASVTIQAPDDCPRYAARLLEKITVGPSPFWLQDKLLSVGLRPINNIVDVTNYVLMETGQPLHAFDYDRLAENRIVVRRARAGETFTTLDQKERPLSEEMLLICDGQKPVAIAGVMGGLNSEIENDTTRVLIESAYFNPVSVRKTSKKLGLNTEASHRFERGVDPQGTVFALNRSAQLMGALGGGTLLGGLIDAHPKPTTSATIRLSISKTNRHLGTGLHAKEITHHLESIAFTVDPEDDEYLNVTPPSFRVDVSRPEDLMEEVARRFGYNNIQATYPLIPAEARKPSRLLDVRQRVKQILTGFGFTEAINYSFMDRRACDYIQLPPNDVRRRLVTIMNPLTEDQAVMRTSMVPGMLGTMHRNSTKQVKNLKLFEIGKIYIGRENDQLPQEIETLTCLWTGSRFPESWLTSRENCDFYDIKGVAEGLFAGLAITTPRITALAPDDCHYLKPGYAGRVTVGGKALGLVGQIHPNVLAHFAIEQAAYLLELDLSALYQLIPEHKHFRPISKYPATTRDITIIVDRNVEALAVMATLEAAAEKLVENIFIFDVFEGHPIPAGKKSISLRITYRSFEMTLEDEAINRLHRDLTARLLQAFDATLPT
jgi:phenylalanyl-tRNA synthetase beta chain